MEQPIIEWRKFIKLDQREKNEQKCKVVYIAKDYNIGIRLFSNPIKWGSMKDEKDIFNQIQDKALQVVDLAKWKLDQQNQLSKLSNEIHLLENEIKEKKVLLADTILAIHSQGKTGEEEIRGICKDIEQLKMGKNRKVKEKLDVKAQQPPQAHLNDNLLPTPVLSKMNDELSALLSQAESVLQGGDRGRAGGLINQALQIDYMYPAIWVLLQQSLGSQQNLNKFQLEFTKKYFPDKLGLLTAQVSSALEDAVLQPPSPMNSPISSSSPTTKLDEEITKLIDLLKPMSTEQIDEYERANKLVEQGSLVLKPLARYKENQPNDSAEYRIADELICKVLGIPSQTSMLKSEKVSTKAGWSALAGAALGLFLSIVLSVQGSDIDSVIEFFFPSSFFFAYIAWSVIWTSSDDLLITGWYFPKILYPLVAIFIAIEHTANIKRLQEQHRIYEKNFKELLFLPDSPLPLKDLPIAKKIYAVPGMSEGLEIFLVLMKGIFLILAVIAMIVGVIYIIMQVS
jgi:hypothetical protein